MAATPTTPSDPPADDSSAHPVTEPAAPGGQEASAGGSPGHPVTGSAAPGGQEASADGSGDNSVTMAEQLRLLKQRWQPVDDDGFFIPTLAQQRADAFVLLFLGRNIDVVTEVVIHVRGDGATFDDGTPISGNAVCQRLDDAFIRMMIQDSQQRPIDASNRRCHPTTRQKRVVLEAHNHECVDY